MSRAQIIEPIKKLLKTEDDLPHRVCAYCRVSTDEDDQRNSLASQKQFFENFFAGYPNWTKAGKGVYADEGLSGTSLEKRDDFNAMLALARYGGADLILTKEVSRFSRNVQHLLNVVEELRDKGVYIWFLSDDINTERAGYREKLTEAATNAEHESLRTSRRVKWGHQQQMQRGVVFGRKEMYGYNIVKDADKKQHFKIIEDEAEIIKQIFEWYASGDGTFTISRRLQEMGIQTKQYKNGWSNTVVLRILRNEKYVGDLAQGKTYTPDPLTHKKKYNHGEYYRFYISDHHPESAIVDRDLWNKVQALLKEKETGREIKAKYNNRCWISGKIFCGLCGGRYVSLTKKQKNGALYKAWNCFCNHQRGLAKQITGVNGEVVQVGCNNKRVNERVLKTALYDIVTHKIRQDKEAICNDILAEIQESEKNGDSKKQIASAKRLLREKSEELQTLTIDYVKRIIPEAAYTPVAAQYNNEIAELQAKILTCKQGASAAVETKIYTECLEQIAQIVSFANSDTNEGFYERITKKIIVYPDNLLAFHLPFMTRPIYLQYRTSGKGKFYKIEFDALTPERFAEILRNVRTANAKSTLEF